MEVNKNMLPKEAIAEYRKLYKERFNKELSDQEAALKANNLFELYKAVYVNSSNKKNYKNY